MTPYDIPASAGPFAASRQSFDALVADLESTRTARYSHDALEDLITGRGRELLRQLLQDHLDLRADREETALAAAREAGRLPAGLAVGSNAGIPARWRRWSER